MRWNVKFVDNDALNPIQAGGATLTKGRKYCQYTNTDMMKYQLKYYMCPGVSIAKFLRANLESTITIPEKTFGTYWSKSGLKNLQEANTPYEIAKIALENHVARVKKHTKNRTAPASESNRYITKGYYSTTGIEERLRNGSRQTIPVGFSTMGLSLDNPLVW
jgi:hypothetical protein